MDGTTWFGMQSPYTNARVTYPCSFAPTKVLKRAKTLLKGKQYGEVHLELSTKDIQDIFEGEKSYDKCNTQDSEWANYLSHYSD